MKQKRLVNMSLVRFTMCLLLMVGSQVWSYGGAKVASEYVGSMEPKVVAQVTGVDESAVPSLRVGDPVPVWKMSAKSAATYEKTGSMSDLLEESKSMFVPIYNGPLMIAFVRIQKSGDGWVAKELGYANLAQEVTMVRQAWPEEAGYELILVVGENLKEFFFSIANYSSANLTEFRYFDVGSTQSAVTKYGVLQSPEAVVGRVIEFVKGGSNEEL